MAMTLESAHFPYLPLRLEVGSRSHDVEALIDTGFDGPVAVPPERVANGDPDDYQRWTLADGSVVYAPLYIGLVQVGDVGTVEAAITALGDEPLVGRGITDRFRLILDHGERVIVER
jgi:predicted aspartyl protease